MQHIKSKVMKLVDSGNLSDARRICLKACKSEPQNAEMWFILSAICGQQSDYKGAELYCKKVLNLISNNPSIYYNLAIAQRGLGKSKEAISSHQQALKLQSDFVPSLIELGNIHLETEGYKKSIEFYDAAIKKQPDAFQAYTAKAKALFKSGDEFASTENYKISLSINSIQPDAYIGLATICNDNNEIDDAIEYNKKAIDNGYEGDEPQINLARLYTKKGDYLKAEEQYKMLLSTQPDNAVILVGLALLYDELFRNKEALEVISRVSSKDMNNNGLVLYNYAKILSSNYRYTDAIECYEKSLDIQPDLAEAMINLGNIFLLSGKVKEAHLMYKRAYDAVPENQDAASNMLMSLNYTNDVSGVDCITMHNDWASNLTVTKIDAGIEKRPSNTRLRVGYISPDFLKQSVSYFFDAILRFSDSERVENYCYSNNRIKDEMTESLRSMADVWVEVYELSDETLANRILEDNIDVLIDLTGHTAGNRLKVFAIKPAPVQLTYLGYPNTTGLSTIDYRLVDQYTDPKDAVIDISEKRLYLQPSFLCYRPVDDCPEVSELPAKTNGYITFGSFNNLAKITGDVIDVWAELLKRVPGSKLCIKARQYADDDILNEHITQFGNRGIDAERLILINYSDTILEHLGRYSDIDIALDTFPYNGTTTTLEAVWMGVPVVSLSGQSHSARVGVSILNNINKPEWLGLNIDEYICIAQKMALDINNLECIRRDLREIVNASPLRDGVTFTKMFENILLAASLH